MSRPPHVCPNKGCRGYALGSDDEQEGAQHHRRRGDDAQELTHGSCFARKVSFRRGRCWNLLDCAKTPCNETLGEL